MALCSGIKADGGRCRAQAMRDSTFCLNHDPKRTEENKHRARRGGRRGGRGRPSSELARLQKRFEELAQDVLDGEIPRADGATAAQIINYARACVRDTLAARGQEEIVERLQALEKALQERKHYPHGA